MTKRSSGRKGIKQRLIDHPETQGECEGSISGKRRSSDEAVPLRRGRPRGAGGKVVRDEVDEEVEERTSGRRVPRSRWPHGPSLRRDFAAGWDGSNLLLDPSSHISHRVLRGKPIGNMRTFSGFSSVFLAYRHVLSSESKALLAGCAFGPLIENWLAISEAAPTANLVVLRAFLDRYWDTTTTFHLPGYEVGITLSSFGVMSGLPCGRVAMKWDFEPPTMSDDVVLDKIGRGLIIPAGRNRSPILIKTIYILEYFQGKGHHKPEEGGHEENARLWLWWFLGATYMGDKGERVGTSTLYYLFDWDRMGDYDWVTPSLGLTIKYCRDAVRPDDMDKGSCPSLVFPGIIMESWVFSHFPSLLPPGFVRPTSYPAVRGWACCDRSSMSWTYSGVRQALNDMSIDKFDHRPWDRYRNVPDVLWDRLRCKDMMRLYLHTPYDSFWYLGERLAYQTCWPQLVVPVDPPACLFLQTGDVETRRQFREGQSDELLLPGLDYSVFASSRLACGPIEVYDEDMEHQPPDFPIAVEYEVAQIRHTLELPQVSPVVMDYGMQDWVSKIKKVSGGIHKKLWRTANRWMDLAGTQAVELCRIRRELATVRKEFEEYRRSHDARKH